VPDSIVDLYERDVDAGELNSRSRSRSTLLLRKMSRSPRTSPTS
jgi:hypothetical protein